jgi:predicted esterase
VGLLHLPLGQGRAALLYVPEGLTHGAPVRLVVTLHDAGGTAEQGMAPLRPFADAAGLVLVAPESAGRTWDLVQDAFGMDVAALDRVLEVVFARFTVDPASIAIAGFSDGASYALSLGLTNGDLFGRIVAFSPGFLSPTARRGAPRVFISHGAFDLVHPVHRGSRRIVPALREAGCEVAYREYVGGHSLPAGVARAAAEWLIGRPIKPDDSAP